MLRRHILGPILNFTLRRCGIQLLQPAFTPESVYGSVEPLNRPEDFDAMIREAKEEHTEDALRKLRGE
jgi:hypothetical protein